MLKEKYERTDKRADYLRVLILILMEHAQRVWVQVTTRRQLWVLILILMEHAQRVRMRQLSLLIC